MKQWQLTEKTLTGNRTLVFKTVRERGRYIALQKNKALQARRQFTFKRNEYLRVYANAKVFYELDIIKPKISKESLDRLFKPTAVA